MSFPCGSNGPFFTLDPRLRGEIAAHRDRVFAALGRHSDPAMREIGRLLARGTVTPQQLLDDPRCAEQKPPEGALEDLRRQVFGPTVPLNGAETPVARSAKEAGTRPGGPASRADFTDPDNGAGGVPAIRR